MSAPLFCAEIEEPTLTDESGAMTGPLLTEFEPPVAASEDDAEAAPLLVAELESELAELGSEVEAAAALVPASFGLGALLHAASAAADRPTAPTASTDRRLTPEVGVPTSMGVGRAEGAETSVRGIFSVSLIGDEDPSAVTTPARGVRFN
jgi:hypothetical protein